MSTPTPEIVLGPPGTGKTTTLLGVVEKELAAGTPPDKIAFVSFTRKAADEAIARACERFGKTREEFQHFRTLHSLCFRQLGLRSADVLEGPRMQAFARWVGVRITGRFSEDGTFSGFDAGDRMLFMENLARIRGVPLRELYDDDSDGLPWAVVDRFSRALAEFKQREQLMDYTDMLSEFRGSGIDLRLQVVVVDETQDLSWLQWQVVYLLARGARRLVVAGDDDQAIYRWAGADVDHLIGLQGEARVLGQSWRVPPAPQKLAATVIERVRSRRPKEWAPRQGEEGVVDRVRQISDLEPGGEDVLVLARNAYVLSEQVEPILRREGVVWERRGHVSIKEGVLRAVETWERLRKGESVPVADARVAYEYMSAGAGVRRGYKRLEQFPEDCDVNIRELVERGGLTTDKIWHEALDRLPADEMSYILAARRRGEKLRARPRVRLSTIHAAKGGEADHVILLTEMARRTYREMERKPDDEARVWYVAITRARRRLTLVSSTTPQRCPWL